MGRICGEGERATSGNFHKLRPVQFSHFTLIAGAMTTVLTLLLIVLIGSALLGFRGYWSCTSRIARNAAECDGDTLMLLWQVSPGGLRLRVSVAA